MLKLPTSLLKGLIGEVAQAPAQVTASPRRFKFWEDMASAYPKSFSICASVIGILAVFGIDGIYRILRADLSAGRLTDALPALALTLCALIAMLFISLIAVCVQ